MSTTKWLIIKNGKVKRIRAPRSQADIEALLALGFVVSKITTVGNKTKIETFSPRTRGEALAEHRRLKQFGKF